jgi:hypothetical protein
MIPPSLQMQQAMRMQQSMMPRGRPEDALLEALSQHQAAGEMLKEQASHAMKMLKLKMKYGGGLQQQSQPPMGAGVPAQTQPGMAPQGGL